MLPDIVSEKGHREIEPFYFLPFFPYNETDGGGVGVGGLAGRLRDWQQWWQYCGLGLTCLAGEKEEREVWGEE